MLRTVIRFIVSAVVLLLVGLVVPGFSVSGFGTALLASLAIAALGWLAERIFGEKYSPQARGLVGFLIAAAVIYLAQFLIPGMRASILGSLLAALVIGVVDAFVPTKLR